MATLKGVRVAKAIYPILLEKARAGATITYGELAGEVVARNPGNEVLGSVIPRSLGPRLLLLRAFTDEQGYPDLSSLVINSRTGEVGEAYSMELDAAHQRELVRAFDWESVLPEFDLFVGQRARGSSATKQPRRKREDAKQVLWQFAKSNPKAPLPSPRQREAVILRLMAGDQVEEAIGAVLAN